MPTESARPLARKLFQVVLGTADVPDRDLLVRFVTSRDEDAFTELMRRHGPMVLAVCRRVTGRPHDAEDAFQAAFLVLARRAKSVGRPELLANWLYGVAYRTALEARAARRRAEEHVVPAAPEPTAPPQPDDPAELRRVIDEELAKLPEKYRTAIVLCDLEGLSRAAAAAQMGIPEGTLSSRLAHGRKLLAQRLARRGVTASAAAVATALSGDVIATAIPTTLMSTTVLAAVRFAPGGAILPGVSPSVSSLAEGVLKAMLVTRLRLWFAFGLLACTLLGVGGVLAQQPRSILPEYPDATAPQPPRSVLPEFPVAAPPTVPPTFIDDSADKPEPKKYGPKGIEDDDVPNAALPSQAVVRVEDGKLIVRQRTYHNETTTRTVDGLLVVETRRKSVVSATTHDVDSVVVLDMKGQPLTPKAWKEAFKKDVHVLVSADGRYPTARELTLFKPDTLLVILPVAPPPKGDDGRPLPPLMKDPKIEPKALPDGVRGTVVKVVDKSEFVLISIGIDAGLEPGSKLDVYREGKEGRYLGMLTVTKSLYPKEAVCEFKPARNVALDKLRAEELPQKGDTVGILKVRD